MDAQAHQSGSHEPRGLPAIGPTTRPLEGLRGWKRLAFYGGNVLLLFHLVAVCSSPLSVPPSSPAEQGLWSFCSPYVQILYQNNGFHFFAPNPEGAYSVVYEVHYADGTSEQGMFPRRDIWPRLLYHRHFMLSEFLGALDGAERERMTRAFARRLCEKHGAERVDMSLQWHDLALRERILAGGTLFDEDLYRLTPLGTYTWDELSSNSETPLATTSDE